MTITWLSPLKTFDSRETPRRNLPPRNNVSHKHPKKMSERDIQDVRWPPLARMADSRAVVLTSEYFQFQHQWKWFELHLERCQQLQSVSNPVSFTISRHDQLPTFNFTSTQFTPPASSKYQCQLNNSTYLLSDSFSSTASSDRLPKTQIYGNGDNLLL